MSVYIVDNGSRYIDELTRLVGGYGPYVIPYDELDIMTLKSTDLVILSGGHGLPVLWHDKDYQREISLINLHRGPIVGVCLGHQLIAHVFGSHLHLIGKHRKGLATIEPTSAGLSLLEDKNYTVYENHGWAVKKTAYPLVSLATSQDGVEILRHANRPIYGVQFHPEAREGVDGQPILEKILAEVTAHMHATAELT